MPADMNETLHDAAALPSHDVPLAGIERRLRTRRRQRIGAALVCGALLVGGIVSAGVLLTGGSEPSVRTTHSVASTATADPGLSVLLPNGWVQTPVDASSEPAVRLMVGTSTIPPDTSAQPCFVPMTPPLAGHAFVQLSEFDVLDQALPPRPSDFSAARPDSQKDCTTPGTDGVSTGVGTSYQYSFQDRGRNFVAIVTIDLANSAELRAQALSVLNSLVVTPNTDVTLQTLLPENVPTTSVPPSTVPTSADTKAITTAFLGWIDTKPADSAIVGNYVEDFAHIRASIAAAAAANGQPNSYTGRIDAITRIGANEADVTYSFLINGQTAVPNLQGKAVKIDGVWKVSRDTVCVALAMGPTRCPPRS